MWNICYADTLPCLKFTSFFSVILVPGSLPWRLQASVNILTNFSGVSTVFWLVFAINPVEQFASFCSVQIGSSAKLVTIRCLCYWITDISF